MLLLLGCGIMIAILLYNDSVFYSLLFDEVLISLELIYSGNEFKEVHQVNYKLIKFESVTILEYYFISFHSNKTTLSSSPSSTTTLESSSPLYPTSNQLSIT
jgi:hypothetical protein